MSEQLAPTKPSIPRYPTPNIASPATPINLVRASVLTENTVRSIDTTKISKDTSPVSDGSKHDADPVKASLRSKESSHWNSLFIKNEFNIEVSRSIEKSASNLQVALPHENVPTRPYIKLGMNKTTKDVVAISRIPDTMGGDSLVKLLSSFGPFETFNWNKIDPTVCQVVYEEPGVARSAVRSLRKTASYLNVQLRTHNSSVQLFVGDLFPSISENMLEATFSRMVGSKVTASLKRDPKTRSTIGYGFLTFKSENDAIKALIEGNRLKIGDATIRIGRAERNCYLYVDEVPAGTSLEDLKASFSKFGELVDEDCQLIRRSDATVKVVNEAVAMFSKLVLENSSAKMKNVSASFGNKENEMPNGSQVRLAVMFKKTSAKPPSALNDLILTTFSKYGNCTVKIPVTRYGKWKYHAIVTFLGEYKAAHLAAVTAMQNVHHVSQVGVHINWAREILPRIPTNVPARTFHKNMKYEHVHGRASSSSASAITNSNIHQNNSYMNATFRARMAAKEFVPRKMEFQTPLKKSGDKTPQLQKATNSNDPVHSDGVTIGSNEDDFTEENGSDSVRCVYSPLPDKHVLYPASILRPEVQAVPNCGNDESNSPALKPDIGARVGLAIEGEKKTPVSNSSPAMPITSPGAVATRMYGDVHPSSTLTFTYGYMGVPVAYNVENHSGKKKNGDGCSHQVQAGSNSNTSGNSLG